MSAVDGGCLRLTAVKGSRGNGTVKARHHEFFLRLKHSHCLSRFFFCPNWLLLAVVGKGSSCVGTVNQIFGELVCLQPAEKVNTVVYVFVRTYPFLSVFVRKIATAA